MERPEPLGRLAGVGCLPGHLVQGRGQRLGQGTAQGGRKLGHVLGTLHPKMETVPDLSHAIGRLALQDLRQLLPLRS